MKSRSPEDVVQRPEVLENENPKLERRGAKRRLAHGSRTVLSSSPHRRQQHRTEADTVPRRESSVDLGGPPAEACPGVDPLEGEKGQFNPQWHDPRQQDPT